MGLLWKIKEEAIRIKTIMPRYLHLEVSRDCNLGCLECYRKDNGSIVNFKGERNLTLEAMKKITEMIPSARTIVFLGDGEPLMNPELGEILRYLSGKNIKSWIITNGTLLTQKLVDEWIRNKVVQIDVSLGAAHKELHEKLKVGSSFEKVVDSLKIVGRSKAFLCINFLVYQETIQELPDLVKLAEKVNCKEINVLFPIFMLNSDLEGSLTRVKDNKQNRILLQEAITLARKARISWIGETPILGPFSRHCNLPFALPYITLENNIYACCYVASIGRTEWYQGIPKELPVSNYLMGNISNTPFKDIWLGKAYKELRNLIKATEKPRRTRITPQELQSLRTIKPDSRFSYCKDCLWRWGSAC